MESSHTHNIVLMHTLFPKCMRIDEHKEWLHTRHGSTRQRHTWACGCVRERRSRPPNRGSARLHRHGPVQHTLVRNKQSSFIVVHEYHCERCVFELPAMNVRLSKIKTPVREAHKNSTTTATTNEINCWPAIQIVQTFWTLPKARIFIIINLFSFCIIWNAHFYAITCSANAMSANFLRIDVWFLDAYITEFESIFIFTISVFALAKELLWLREIDEWIIMRRKSMRR